MSQRHDVTRVSMAFLLGFLYFLSEIALTVFRRARTGAAAGADRGSLRLLWIVIMVSVMLAYALPGLLPWAQLRVPMLYRLGVALLIFGLGLRWYAIIWLGRWFTVNVAVAADQPLVNTGPYAQVRHPSYTGALLAFAGIGLCIGNWVSMLVVCIGPFLAFARRMQVEEEALVQGLGEPYRDYMRHTRRLVPGIY